MHNFRTWRDREGWRMMEKAAFGALFPPTVSRIEVRVVGGWMTWAEASRSTGGSDSGKIISWGWNDFNWCSRELHGEMWPGDSWRWEVTSNAGSCNGNDYRGAASLEDMFLLWCGESCGLGLWTSGHWKLIADKDGKGTLFHHNCSWIIPALGRKLPHSWSNLKIAVSLGIEKKSSVLKHPTPTCTFSPSIFKPHLCSYVLQAHHLGVWKVSSNHKPRRISHHISKGIP